MHIIVKFKPTARGALDTKKVILWCASNFIFENKNTRQMIEEFTVPFGLIKFTHHNQNNQHNHQNYHNPNNYDNHHHNHHYQTLQNIYNLKEAPLWGASF